MNLFDHGERKFPNANLLVSSANLGWHGIAAELRSHPAGELPNFQPDQIEITIAVAGVRDAFVSRKGAGQRQETRVDSGAIWISPVGVTEDDIRISKRLPEILHIYLAADLFSKLSDAAGGAPVAADSIRYLAGIRDDLVRQMGLALLDELKFPTGGGKVLAETFGLSLTARLAQAYAANGGTDIYRSLQRHRLSDIRTNRVIDYMLEHLGSDIGLEELAAVACLSTFHFSRMFQAKTGISPHRYLSMLRLESAKKMLVQHHHSLTDIALACGFSNHTNFARAFKKSVGTTPGQFRRNAPCKP